MTRPTPQGRRPLVTPCCSGAVSQKWHARSSGSRLSSPPKQAPARRRSSHASSTHNSHTRAKHLGSDTRQTRQRSQHPRVRIRIPNRVVSAASRVLAPHGVRARNSKRPSEVVMTHRQHRAAHHAAAAERHRYKHTHSTHDTTGTCAGCEAEAAWRQGLGSDEPSRQLCCDHCHAMRSTRSSYLAVLSACLSPRRRLTSHSTTHARQAAHTTHRRVHFTSPHENFA